MIYYTSDLHFGHSNIIKYEHRPFTDVQDMTNKLIENWNSVVKDNDTVYILGDFAFNGSASSVDDINNIVFKLKGEKHLIIGNHDQFINKQHFKPLLWKEITPYKRIKDTYIDELGEKHNRIVCLFHYPIEHWDMQMYGSIHLHGHLHSKPTRLYQENRYNVGCDLWDYKPVTLQQIIEKYTIYEDDLSDKFFS